LHGRRLTTARGPRIAGIFLGEFPPMTKQ